MSTPAMHLMASEAEFELEAGSHAPGDLLVLSFDADEEISRPFSVDILVANGVEISIDGVALIGQRATLVTHLGDGTDRLVAGIVASVRSWQEGSGEQDQRARIRLVPRLWKLGQIRRSRIFQRLSVPDIVKKVLDGSGVPSRSSLSAAYAPRDYCVQYAETDLDFVQRLLEEEGIFYFFDHGTDGDIVVLGDANGHCPNIPGDARVVFREPSGAVAEAEHFSAFTGHLEVRPTSVVLRDFDYLRPAVDLTATAGSATDLEVYDYPGGYADGAAGRSRAQFRLESERARAETFAGTSICRRLAAGSVFELDEHPIGGLNDQYLVVSVQHDAEQPEVLAHGGGDETPNSYRNVVRCIRRSVPFRPERRTTRPVIPGPQTAIVTGPSGEEIHTDEHGRIKVKFHWDREGQPDDTSSCWIRVSQAWAGPGWGALYLPRIGQEVVVEFLEGDPDRPVVTGAVYNGMNPPPVTLPSEKTKSTMRSATSPGSAGSNELRFEDAQGQEEVFLHAQKDLSIVVENDKTQTVGANERLTVGADRSRRVGGNQALQVTGNDDSTVGGNQSLQVTVNRSTTVGGNHTESITGDQMIDVGGSLALSVGMASNEVVALAKALTVGGAYAITVGGAMNELVGAAKSEEVGGAKVEMVAGKRTETVAGARSVDVGGDLSETVGGKKTVKVARDLVMDVGGKLAHTATNAYTLKAQKITLSAANEMVLKVGSSTVTLKQSGDVIVKGTKIELKASGDLVLKAMKISEN